MRLKFQFLQKKTGETSFFLLKKLLYSNTKLKIFHFFQIFIYQLIGFLFKSSLTSFFKKNNIKVINLKKYPDTNFIKKNIRKLPVIIFASTTTILKEMHLKNNIILNFHEGPKNYKGSAIFYHFALKKEKDFYTMITQPDLGIDTGKIVCKSKKVPIKNLSIFEIFLYGVFLQSNLIFKVLNKKLKKNKYQLKKITKNSYSYPFSNADQILKKNKIRNIEIIDLFYILKLSFTKDIDQLYNYIKSFFLNEK